jgi:hypothetical protein
MEMPWHDNGMQWDEMSMMCQWDTMEWHVKPWKWYDMAWHGMEFHGKAK